MSIEIGRARELLDILDQLENQPKLIFSDLFVQGQNDYSFLSEIDIKGKVYSEYISECLQSLSPFSDTTVSVWANELCICMPSIGNRKYHDFQSEDKIIQIDLEKKQYKLCNDSIGKYRSIMEEKYELATCELSDFWKRFENFSFKKRLKTAFSYLFSDKKLYIRLCDFVYALVVSRKKIDALINIQKENINRTNERNLRNYTEKIEKQKFVLEHAPVQIEKILAKQEEIAGFLRQMGYEEVES